MSEKKNDEVGDTATDDGQGAFKRAVIIYAIIEALILIPLIIYLALR